MPETTTVTSRRFVCRHIHPTGHRCGSPCLRGQEFCYFHHTSRPPARSTAYISPDAAFDLPALDTRLAVQLALSDLARRIALNQIDHDRARLLLTTLRIASANLRREAHENRPTPNPNHHNTNTCRDSTRYHDPSSRPTHNNAATPDDPDPDTDPSDLTADPIEDLVLDPHLGPLAPIAEILPPNPEDKPLTLLERYFRDLRKARPLCPLCNPDDGGPKTPNPNPDPTPTEGPDPTNPDPKAPTTPDPDTPNAEAAPIRH